MNIEIVGPVIAVVIVVVLVVCLPGAASIEPSCRDDEEKQP